MGPQRCAVLTPPKPRSFFPAGLSLKDPANPTRSLRTSALNLTIFLLEKSPQRLPQQPSAAPPLLRLLMNGYILILTSTEDIVSPSIPRRCASMATAQLHISRKRLSCVAPPTVCINSIQRWTPGNTSHIFQKNVCATKQLSTLFYNSIYLLV